MLSKYQTEMVDVETAIRLTFLVMAPLFWTLLSRGERLLSSIPLSANDGCTESDGSHARGFRLPKSISVFAKLFGETYHEPDRLIIHHFAGMERASGG